MDAVARGVLPFMVAELAIMFVMGRFPSLVMVPARWSDCTRKAQRGKLPLARQRTFVSA
jgi:hypothetical protein